MQSDPKEIVMHANQASVIYHGKFIISMIINTLHEIFITYKFAFFTLKIIIANNLKNEKKSIKKCIDLFIFAILFFIVFVVSKISG